MMMQLNPPIPLDTPKGPALGMFLIDYGPEHDLMWVTFTDATGECWTWPNPKVRAQKNITMGRRNEAELPVNGHDGAIKLPLPEVRNGNGHHA